MVTDVRLDGSGHFGTSSEGDPKVLRDTTLEVLLCLATIDSIAAIALILVDYARHAVHRHLIFQLEYTSNGER